MVSSTDNLSVPLFYGVSNTINEALKHVLSFDQLLLPPLLLTKMFIN